VNDAPEFTLGGDQTVDEDAGAQSVSNFLTGETPGPADESSQTLSVGVTNDNNPLFSAQPTIDLATGELTYTPAADVNGAATVTVTLTDSGPGSAPDENATSKTFRITVTPLNDPPTITSSATVGAAENQTAVVDVQSTDLEGDTEGSRLRYSLTGGADQALFGIDVNTGVLTFNAAPDYENPADSGANNVYDVQVTVADSGSLTDVQDIAVTVTDVNEDFGDAPTAAQSGFAADYPTVASASGASHVATGPRLGAGRDAETNGIPDAGALGDDNDNTDDEDGITALSTLLASTTNITTSSVDVDLQNADASSNRLDAWVDFNRDGLWDNATEKIIDDCDLGTTDALITVPFLIPQDTGSNVDWGDTFARFRLSTLGGLLPTGNADDGEVEDYPVVLIGSIIQFSQATFQVNEDGTPSGVQVTLTRNTTVGTSQVQVGFGNMGTATAGTDYDNTPIDVTFDDGEDTATVAIPNTQDDVVELDETIDLEVTAISGTLIGTQNTATLTVLDDDSATLSIDDVVLAEGDAGTTVFTFTVTLAGDVDVPLGVSFATMNGAAQDENGDVDYLSATGRLNFAGADEQRTIAITVTADDVLEPDEDFFVNLTSIDAAGRDVTFADDQGRGLILRDEPEENLVTVVTGEISGPGEVDGYRLEVTQGTLYSVQVCDHRGVGFDPDAVEIIDAEGNPVPVLEVIRDAAGAGPARSAVVVDLPPGIYRVFVRSQNGTVAPYRVDLRLPGAVNGERIVSQRAVQLAEAAMLQRYFGFNAIAQELFGGKLGIELSADQFCFEFDANLNGIIDATDLDVIIRNYANGLAVESLATLTPLTSGSSRGGSGEAESDAEFKLSDASFSVYQNPETPTDVDANGQVTPLDALLVVNALNAIGSTSIDAVAGQDATAGEGEASAAIAPPFVDVNGDYVLSPLDVLLVVNDLNSPDSSDGTAGAEGEAVALAWADIGKPPVADASRSGDHDITLVATVWRSGDHDTTRDHDITKLFGTGQMFGAGLSTPPEPLTAGLHDSPSSDTLAQIPSSPVRGPEALAQRRRVHARVFSDDSQLAESIDPEAGLLNLLAEDIETVWTQ